MPASSSRRARPIAASTSGEALIRRPCSSHVYQVIETPGQHRHLFAAQARCAPVADPRAAARPAPGPTASRRARRNSASSARWSIRPVDHTRRSTGGFAPCQAGAVDGVAARGRCSWTISSDWSASSRRRATSPPCAASAAELCRGDRTPHGHGADDRRRTRRAARALVGWWRAAGADPRPSRHGVPDRHAGRAAVRRGRRARDRAGRVRHEGRHRAGDPRRRRPDRRVPASRCCSPPTRRSGRSPRANCSRHVRWRAATCSCSSRAPTAARSRPAARAPARSRSSFERPRRPRRARAGEGRQRADRGRPSGARDRGLRRRRHRHHRHADGRPRRHRRQRGAGRGAGPGRRARQRRRREAAHRSADGGRCNRCCEGSSIEVVGGIGRPPMPESASATLFPIARRGAARACVGVAVGGGSDGNFTAALGVPDPRRPGRRRRRRPCRPRARDRRHDARPSRPPPRHPRPTCSTQRSAYGGSVVRWGRVRACRSLPRVPTWR